MYLSKKLKRKLPSYLKLEEFKFDINKLREATSHFEDEFIHLKNANSNLEKSHSEFVRKIADVYFEVPLTIYSGESTQIANLDPEGNTRIKKLENYPLLDEWNYGKSTPRFLQSYFYECCQALGMPIYRVRLAKWSDPRFFGHG